MAPAVQPAYPTGTGPAVGDGTWISRSHNELVPNLVGLDMATMQKNGMGNRFASHGGYRQRIYAHGVLGTVSFLILVPAAVMVAQFSRSHQYRQRASALRLHVRLHLIAVAMATATFILGWTAVGSQRSLTNPHHGIGVALYVMLLAQVAAGFYCARRRPDGRRLLLRSWTHKWLGRLTALLGMSQVPLGLCLYGSTPAFFVLYAVVAAVLVLLYIVLSYVYDEADIREPFVPDSPISPRPGKGMPLATTHQRSRPGIDKPHADTDDIKATNTAKHTSRQEEEKGRADYQSPVKKAVHHSPDMHVDGPQEKPPDSLKTVATTTPIWAIPASKKWPVDEENGKTTSARSTVHINQSHEKAAGYTIATTPAIRISPADDANRKAEITAATGKAAHQHPEPPTDQPHEDPVSENTPAAAGKTPQPAKRKRKIAKKPVKRAPLPPVVDAAAPEQEDQLPSRLSSWDNIPEHYRLEGDETDVQSVSSYLWDAGSAHRRAFASRDGPMIVLPTVPPTIPPTIPPQPSTQPVNGDAANPTGALEAGPDVPQLRVPGAVYISTTISSRPPTLPAGGHIADPGAGPGSQSDAPRLRRVGPDTNIAQTVTFQQTTGHHNPDFTSSGRTAGASGGGSGVPQTEVPDSIPLTDPSGPLAGRRDRRIDDRQRHPQLMPFASYITPADKRYLQGYM